MHIIDSELTLSNQHQERSRHHRTEMVVARLPESSSQASVEVAISHIGASLQRASLSKVTAEAQMPNAPSSKADATSLDEQGLPPKYRAMKRMIELLTGEKLDLSLQTKLQKLGDTPTETPLPNKAEGPSVSNGNDRDTDNNTREWVWVHERIEWAQHNHFTASGNLNLANGDSIDFAFEVEFGQMHLSETSQLVTREQLKDPLVLTFDGGPVRLADGNHQFDLDSDGSDDTLPFLAPRQAYLAWDRNQDGIINDGSELFGARTNNGFAELAEWDDDGNGFIDEGDEVYDQLQLWFKDANQDRQISLQRADVAAIGLAHTSTPYRLLDRDDQQQGVIRESGVFINSHGHGGLVQQIDLKI